MSDTKLNRNLLLAAAQGKIECDLKITGAQVLDVFTCEWVKRDLAIYAGVIVGFDESLNLKAKQTLVLKNRFIVPGFIDAHVHIESSLLTPSQFQNTVLPKGTTSAICDPHELANVMGLSGIQYFLDESLNLDLNLQVMLSSCVPATHFETNGGGTLSSIDLEKLIHHPKALGLAEVMNVPGVLNGDPEMLAKLDAFKDGPIDGHCPLLRGLELSAYAAMGITSCHESSEIEEAREKLQKGISIWIREGSVAKDLHALAPLLNLATSTSMGFCTDDRNPLDISLEGHLDHLIRTAIKLGVDPRVAYRTASWSVARHYGLKNLGAIAPGYTADFVVLSDPATCSIDQVFKSGKSSDEYGTLTHPLQSSNPFFKTVKAVTPETIDLEGPVGSVNVIGVIEGKIITEHKVMNNHDRGVAKFSVLERHGKGLKPANAYAFGFGENFNGAIASSVGHDSHNLAVVGSNTKDMQCALSSIIQSQGGFSVVQNGVVLAHLALPLGGLMSNEAPDSISKSLLKLREASRLIGCELSEPFLQLAFLCLPVIPSLKLTDQGLVDVNQFKIIPVAI